jgi:hypothetical protein
MTLEKILIEAETKLQEAYQLIYAGLHICGRPCGPVLDKIAGASLAMDKLKKELDLL